MSEFVDLTPDEALMVAEGPGTLRDLVACFHDRGAEIERLRSALEHIAEEHDAGRHDGIPEPCPAHDADTMWAIARIALKRQKPTP